MTWTKEREDEVRLDCQRMPCTCEIDDAAHARALEPSIPQSMRDEGLLEVEPHSHRGSWWGKVPGTTFAEREANAESIAARLRELGFDVTWMRRGDAQTVVVFPKEG